MYHDGTGGKVAKPLKSFTKQYADTAERIASREAVNEANQVSNQRAPALSKGRAEELAALIKELIPDVDATRLKAHANWLAGGARAR